MSHLKDLFYLIAYHQKYQKVKWESVQGLDNF